MAEVIVALDVPTARQALAVVDRLPGLRWAKVGATLFAAAGPEMVRELKARGIRVFLDLKWHDIPHQVAGAVEVAAGLGVDLATVHALGGRAMLEAAAGAAHAGGGTLRVVAVSVLTSHDAGDWGDLTGRPAPELSDEVVRLTRLALEAGCDGVVASAHEVAAVAPLLGPDRWTVVPGIRPTGSAPGDQRRTATAAEAVRVGATHLVVGRPITSAVDPAAVYEQLCEDAR